MTYLNLNEAVADGWYVALNKNTDDTYSGQMKRHDVVIEEHYWQGRTHPTVEALAAILLERCNSRTVDR